jgi:hypothetical protein
MGEGGREGEWEWGEGGRAFLLTRALQVWLAPAAVAVEEIDHHNWFPVVGNLSIDLCTYLYILVFIYVSIYVSIYYMYVCMYV